MDILAQFKNYLLSQKNQPSKVTVKNYLSDINHFIKFFEDQYKKAFSPSEISFETIRNYKTQSASVLSESSLDRHMSSLRKFFYFLKLEGYISSDPFKAVLPQPVEVKDPWHIKEFKNYLYVFNASNLTIKNYIIDIRQFLTWAETVTPNSDLTTVGKINKELIEEYKQRLITHNNFSATTVNRKLSSLRKYLSWAQEEGFIKAQPEVTNYQTPVFTTQPEAISQELSKIEEPRIKNYSWFPPLRVAQKMGLGFQAIFDKAITETLAKGVRNAEYIAWKVKGKHVFTEKSNEIKAKIPDHNFLRVSNIKKEFYAPLAISTANLPSYKKYWIALRYKRPNWYKTYHSYPLAHYLNFAVLIIIMAAIGFGFYTSFFDNPKNQSPILAAAPVAPPRILSFQGRLTDSNDNPITSPTWLRFGIYTSATASDSGTTIFKWQEADYVSPDTDGIFNVLLGQNSVIPPEVFTQNSALWLGVTVGQTAELTPRQPLATVAYATNAETLQGMYPTTATTSATNVILALDSSGNLSIGGTATPTFQATGGQFKLLGQPLVLGTNVGSNANVTISPDGLGKIDLQKPLQNSSYNNNIRSSGGVSTAQGAVEVDDMFAVLATSSGQSAVTINQDSTGPIISASASGVAKFTVDASGNVTAAGNGIYSGTFTVNGNTLSIGNGSAATINTPSGNANLTIAPNGTGVLNLATTNTGNVSIGNSTGTITLNSSTTLTSGKTLTLGGITGNNAVLYATTGTGVVTSATTSTAGQCLVSGGSTGYAPTWGSCSTGNYNFWQELTGALSPVSSSDDLLIGGSATSSADFAFTGLGLANHQTQASFSGQLVVMPNNGYSGRVGIGTTAPATSLDINGDARLSQTLAQADYQTDDGLMLYYPFSETAGTTVYDRGPEGTDGVFSHGSTGANPTFTTGKSGNALSFTGTGGASSTDASLVLATLNTTQTAITSITWEAWIYPTDVTKDQIFIAQQAVSNYFRIFNNKLFVSFYNPTQRTLAGNTTLQNNTWYHVAATYNASDGRINIYLNGVLDATSAPAAGSLDFNGTNIFELGALNAAGNYSFGGKLDEVRIFDHALDADQIKLQYLRGSRNSTVLADVFRVIDLNNDVNLYVNNSGNVGIGTTAPTAMLDVAGTASVGGQLKFRSGTAQIQATADQLLTMGGDTTGNITFSPYNTSTLTISPNTLTFATSGSIYTSANNNLSLNAGTGTIFLNNGTAGGITTGTGAIALNGSTTIASGKTLTLGGITGNNAVLYATTGTGVVTSATTSTSGQCLLSGPSAGYAPSWGTCPTTYNFWQELAGALSPVQLGDDLLLGGSATASADFAFTGMSGNQTQASFSGQLNVVPNKGYGGGINSYNGYSWRGSPVLTAYGTSNIFVGGYAGNPTASGYNSTLGANTGAALTSGSENVLIGYDTGYLISGGGDNTAIGAYSGQTLTTGGSNTLLGAYADASTNNISDSVAIGYGATVTANNQMVVGGTGASTYINDIYLGSGVTKATPTGVTINASGGNGTNNAGANLTIAGGKGTGNAAGGSIIFQTSNAGATGTTLQSLATRLTIDASGNVTMSGTGNFSTGTGSISLNGSTTLASGKTLTLSGITGNNAVLYATTGTGLITSATTSTSGQCLLSGPSTGYAPSWGTCPGGSGGGFWQELAGALSPVQTGDDLLIGGSATASADFAFTGLKGNQTQASFSGQFIVMPNNGYGGRVGIGVTAPDNLIQVANLIDFDGQGNTLLGSQALGNGVQSGTYDTTAVGYQASYNDSSTGPNTSFGYQANMNATGGDFVAVGFKAGYGQKGGLGVAIGDYALGGGNAQGQNTAIGYDSQWLSSTGYSDTSVGRNSLEMNTIGYHNTAIGDNAFSNTLYASGSSALGSNINYYIPGNTMTATAVAGTGLSIGCYYYGVSYVFGTNETDANNSQLFGACTTSGNQQVNLASVPTGPSGTTARKIYRTKVGGTWQGGTYYYVATIANNTATTYSDTTADASLTVQQVSPKSVIALGAYATPYFSNQFIAGSDSYPITNMYLGRGYLSATPSDIAINATGGNGTNIAGANLLLNGGIATGNAAGGSVIFQTSATGSTGTTPETLTTRFTIDGSGNISQSGTGTFATGTGAVSLNGNTTIPTGKSLTLVNNNGNNAVLYSANSSGTVTSVVATTTSGQCLLSGASIPAWGSCPNLGGFWQELSGALSPVQSGDDLLIGGSATASADFAFTGLKGNTTQASFSGQFIVMPNKGYGGMVGIGTAAPKTSLQVSSQLQAAIPALGQINLGVSSYLTNSDTNYGLLSGVLSNGNGWMQVQRTDGTATAYNLQLQTNGGNVGIGTANIPAKLSLAINGATGDTTNYGNGIQITNDATKGQQAAFIRAGNRVVSLGYLPNSNNFGFGNGNATDSSFTPSFLSMDFNGNIGMGTSTPLAGLDVRGAPTASPIASFSGTTSAPALGIDSNTGAGDLINASSGQSPALGRLQFKVTNLGSVYGRSFIDLDNNSYFLDPAASGTSLNVAGNASIAGTAGIGTTAPTSVIQLDVAGLPARFQQGIISGWTATTGAGTYTNQWFPIATVSISSQYQYGTADILISKQGAAGSQSDENALVHLQVKQQAAFGSNPIVSLQASYLYGIPAANIVFVLTSNAGPTTGTLYVKNPTNYEEYTYTALSASNNITIAGTNASPVASLPAGTQTTPTYGFYSYGGDMGIGTTNLNVNPRLQVVGATTGQARAAYFGDDATNTQALVLGYDFTNGYGWLDGLQENVAWKGVELSPNAAKVLIGAGSNTNWGVLNIAAGTTASINAAGNIYSYSRICAGNSSGSCNSTGGVVISGTGSNVYGSTYLTGSGNSYFNGGNVGIGNTSPAEDLSIGNGTANSNWSIGSSSGNRMYMDTYIDAAYLAINRRSSDGAFARSTYGASSIGFVSDTSGGYFDFNTINAVNTNPTLAMRINETHYVGLYGLSTGAASNAYLAFYDSGGTRIGYVGDGSSGNSDMYLVADTAGALHLGGNGASGVLNIDNSGFYGNVVMDPSGSASQWVTVVSSSSVAGQGGLRWTQNSTYWMDTYLTGSSATTGKLMFERNGSTSLMSISLAGVVRALGTITGGVTPDYAETIRIKDQSIESGDIVAAQDYDNSVQNIYQKALASKTSTPYSPGLIGAISENPGILISDNNIESDNLWESNERPLTVAGRIPVKVTAKNGPIKVGDLVTSSEIPGIGMKATKAGMVVGTAMTDFDPSSATQSARLVNGQWQVSDSVCTQNEPDCYPYEKILVFVKPGFMDPQVYLTSTGDMSIVDQATPSADFTVPHYYSISDALGNPIDRVGAFAQLAVANLRAGVVNAQQIIVNGQNLGDYIATIVNNIVGQNPNGQVVSPIASDSIKTNLIAPTATSSAVALRFESDKLSVLNTNNSSGSAVATIDNQGNASFSGKLTSNQLYTNDASISGTLHVGKIIADQIVSGSSSATYVTNITNVYNSTPSSNTNFGLVNGSSTSTSSGTTSQTQTGTGYMDISSMSGQLSYVPTLSSQTAAFTEGLTVFGPSSLSDVSITGQVAINGSLILANNSINVLGSDFNIQPLKQGGVSIMAGLVYIDTNGNVTFGSDVQVKGTLYANAIAPIPGNDLAINLASPSGKVANLNITNATGSSVLSLNGQSGDLTASGAGTFAKLNLSLIQPAQALSETEITATGSAGTAWITAHQKEVTIDNTLVTDKSLIYITPTADTKNQVMYLIRQVPGQSFTVGIPDFSTTNIPFNWMIVN